MDFIKLVDICLKADLPLALYRLPGKNEILLIISERNAEKISFPDLKQKERGFVLHPFKDSQVNPIWYLNADIIVSSEDSGLPENVEAFVKTLQEDKVEAFTIGANEDINKVDYLSKVGYLVDRINTSELSKIVFSKTKTIDPFEKYELSELFFKMEKKYSDAFVFIVNIPGEFSWIGATPELLLNCENNRMNTVALAGTQMFVGDDVSAVKWGSKDIEEQQFVCDYIEEKIEELGFQCTKAEPITSRAGEVVHIKTEYSIEGSKEKYWDLVNKLHPTPAVCGTPKGKSLKLIEEVENHDRSYYAGFLGPVDIMSERRMFVNLRCAKYSEGSLSLYVGGGITGQSVPEKEWEETELKAETLIKLL